MMSSQPSRIDWEAVRKQLQEAELALETAAVVSPQKIERVYRERAHQLAGRHIEGKADVQSLRVLVFFLGTQKYGIPLIDLAEVLPSGRCTPVPGAAAELVGVINLRGEIRSVIDLPRLLNLPVPEQSAAGCVLIVRHGLEPVGLQVGPVDKTQFFAENELSLPDYGGPQESASYLKGLSADRVMIIDTPALLSHPVFKTKLR